MSAPNYHGRCLVADRKVKDLQLWRTPDQKYAISWDQKTGRYTVKEIDPDGFTTPLFWTDHARVVNRWFNCYLYPYGSVPSSGGGGNRAYAERMADYDDIIDRAGQ